jgi:peptidoglycan/LPS O-acetylase OafA/YrhL
LAIGVILAWLSVFCKDWWRSGRGKYWIPALAFALGMAEHELHTVTLSFTALGLLYGGFVIVGLRSSVPNRLTNWRIFHVLSRLSYGSYLNNLILLQLIDPYTHRYVSAHGASVVFFGLWFIGFVLLSNAVAFVTYAFIEVPFLERREAWLAREKQPLVPQMVAPSLPA